MEEPAARNLRIKSFKSDDERNQICNCDIFQILVPHASEI
jgi:hypothetical protein